jgi:hypothetical protein
MNILRTMAATYLDAEGGSGGGSGDPAGGGAPAPWYQTAGVAPEHHEWLAGKQFADPSIAIASHRSLEGIIGRNRLAVPTGPEDHVIALGRPKDATGYAAKEGSRIAADELKEFAPVFHKLGLSKAQADGLLEFYEGRAIAKETVTEGARKAAEDAQIAALEQKWGSSAAANQDIASRAFRALGVDEETADKIEGAIGYQATMELFHKIGAGMSESSFHQDGKPGGGEGGKTVDTLRNDMNTKLRDAEFRKRYDNADPRVRETAIKEIEALQIEIAKREEGEQNSNSPFKRGSISERMTKANP